MEREKERFISSIQGHTSTMRATNLSSKTSDNQDSDSAYSSLKHDAHCARPINLTSHRTRDSTTAAPSLQSTHISSNTQPSTSRTSAVMAAAFLPPLDFACSERNLATAATQSATQTIQDNHPEDDGNSEYATTTASGVVSNINETVSVAASIQPDEEDESTSPNAHHCEPGDDSKILQSLSRLLSRRGTANSRGSKRLAKRAPRTEMGDAGPECDTRLKRTWPTVSKKNGRQDEVKSYRVSEHLNEAFVKN